MANHAGSSVFEESAPEGIQDFNSPMGSVENEPVNFEATQYVPAENNFSPQTNYESIEAFPEQGIVDPSAPNEDFQVPIDSNNFEGNFEQANIETDGFSEQEPSDSAPYDFNQPLGTIPQPHQDVVEQDPSNLSDIAEFANSNEVTSGLSYSVTIDGIENFALVKALREAMEDSKFGWDTSALLDSIQGGRLVVKRLSPVKASIFIGRIKYLPLTISWKQEVLGG